MKTKELIGAGGKLLSAVDRLEIARKKVETLKVELEKATSDYNRLVPDEMNVLFKKVSFRKDILATLRILEQEAKDCEADGRKMARRIAKTIDGMVKAITKELKVVHEKTVRFYIEDELMASNTMEIYWRY
jgi:pimeloyl-CoA synthetase